MSDASNNYFKAHMPVFWNQDYRPVEMLSETVKRIQELPKRTKAKRLLLKAGFCNKCCHEYTKFESSDGFCFCDLRHSWQSAFPKERYCDKWEEKLADA